LTLANIDTIVSRKSAKGESVPLPDPTKTAFTVSLAFAKLKAAVKFSLANPTSALALHQLNLKWYRCWWPWIYAAQQDLTSLSSMESYVQQLSLSDVASTIEGVQSQLGLQAADIG
jgi:hypothetical protein